MATKSRDELTQEYRLDLVQLPLSCCLSIVPGPELWTVGYYAESGEWMPLADCGSEDEALEVIEVLLA